MDSSTQQSGPSASPNISASSLPPATKSSQEPRPLLADDNQAEGFSESIIDLGTRPVIGSASASTRSEISQNDSGDVTLNVVDAEIRDVVRLVLEDALGANYAIDPAVTGKITVRTSRPIPANDVMATLGSILSLNGVALVEADGLYRVLPAERAAFAGYRPIGRIAGRSRGAASDIQVAPLNYADAGQLAGLLQPFVDRQGDGVQVYVDEVQNARATDLASALGELFDIQSTSFGGESLLAPGLELVSLGAPFSSFEAADDIGDEERAAPTARERGQRDAVGIGQSPSRQSRQALTEGRSDSDAKIVADETNSALLVRATPQEYKKIEGALRALDKQPLQVLLEATIAEVSLTNELSYGVRWFFGSGDSGVTLRAFTDGSVGQLFPGFSGLLSRGDVRIVLNALDSVSEDNVVSSPLLLVLDNQTAQLQVGDEVPIVTQPAEGIETSDARIVNTVEQRQTGVILSVTPRVNANGRLILDIEQEVSDVVQTTTSGIDSPTIAQQRISTSVVVSSDQTVVLGGLIEDDVDEINTGVPLLKDIPFIGALFSATTKVTDRKNFLS